MTGTIGKSLVDYLRMIKFSHTVFALPFAGIAFLLALPGSEAWNGGSPGGAFYLLLGQIIICMASLRSAAMGFNRLADREIDAANPRTAVREIPRGVISPGNARLFIIISSLIFIATAFWINTLCGMLSPVAIALALGYSYSKRFTMFCHYILGLAIGIAPLAAWLAVRGTAEPLPLLWSGGLMMYIAGFDILYSCQDAAFDKEQGLHSLPARLGVKPAIYISRLTHLAAVGFFLWAGIEGKSGPVFWGALGIVALLFLTEHVLVRPGRLEKIPAVFFNVNAAISMVLFLGLLLDVVLRGA